MTQHSQNTSQPVPAQPRKRRSRKPVTVANMDVTDVNDDGIDDPTWHPDDDEDDSQVLCS
jgi:hypothetical protein